MVEYGEVKMLHGLLSDGLGALDPEWAALGSFLAQLKKRTEMENGLQASHATPKSANSAWDLV